jgi:tetratricopeptide (TPR) repeat protein
VGCADTVTFSKDAQAKGLTLYNNAEYADAAGAFKNAVRQRPTDYQAWFWLGQSQEKLGQQHEAIHSYRTALDVQTTTLEGKENIPFRQNILNALAQAIAKSDSAEIETQSAENKAHSNPSPENYFLVAKINAFRGDADNALDAYTRAQRLDRNDFYITKEYGLYLERLGQPEQAKPLLTKAYGMNPQDAQVDAARRRLGIVPGPSLKEKTALAHPPVPEGPIPPVQDWTKGWGNNSSAARPAPAPSSPTVQAPRD